MKSDNITVTQARMKQALDKGIGQVIENHTQQIVKMEFENLKIRTGVVTKFYPYWDKAEVQLDNANKKVLCRILHRFGGELTEYYTPSGDEDYDVERKEKCVIPRTDLHCYILNVPDINEYLLLGFYAKEELIGVNPASPGNFKIVTRGGTNQFWIKFGYDGLDLRLPSQIATSTGAMDEEMIESKNVNSDDFYTKKEIDAKLQEIEIPSADVDAYTRTEVNELLSTKEDKVEGKGLSTEDYTTAEKTKLTGISENANNYTHPNNHLTSIIKESSALTYLGLDANASQHEINIKINEKINNLHLQIGEAIQYIQQ